MTEKKQPFLGEPIYDKKVLSTDPDSPTIIDWGRGIPVTADLNNAPFRSIERFYVQWNADD